MTQQIWAHNIKDEDCLPFCVQTIGKNGSTRLHKWLLEYEFINCNYKQIANSSVHKDSITYVFIQDPVVKFIKGFCEIISNLRPVYWHGEIEGIDRNATKLTPSPAAGEVDFRKILSVTPEDAVNELLFSFLEQIDMYKWDYHVKLQMDIIKLISKYNLSYEILHISDIDNFHNIVKEKHTQAFKAIEFIWPDGFKPIEPERTEKNDRKLIEEKVFKLVYEHINGDLSCIKEYLEPDIGLWEIFNNKDL